MNSSDIYIKEKIKKEIAEWVLGKERFLNVVSPPYNFSEIFLDAILKYISLNKKVLYITNENVNNIHIIKNIKRNSSFRKYTYFKDNSNYKDVYLVISKKDILYKIEDKFDLVIYDDIKSFSIYDKYEIINCSINKCKLDGKIIFYSIEKILEGSGEILFPVRENNYPIIEPRFINTRIDINKDIPYVIYEYLKWSISSGYKVVIYVPSEEKVENVYKYLYKYCNKFSRNIMYYIKNKDNEKVIYNFFKMKRAILITNSCSDVYVNFKNVNIMIFFVDNKFFDYKKLIYLCGKVGINKKTLRGEVIFLGNYETNEIDKAKSITRYFNKEAWEMNLLRI